MLVGRLEIFTVMVLFTKLSGENNQAIRSKVRSGKLCIN